MARVTALEPHARRPDRLSVFVDGAFVAEVSAPTARALGLEEGGEATAADVAAVAAAAEVELALSRACRYLRDRPRSRREVERRLRRYGHPEDVAAAVLELLAEQRLVDDAAFAAAWVRDRMALKPKGRAALRAELAVRGVAAADVEGAFAAHFPAGEDEEVALARRAAEPRLARLQARGGTAARAALYSFLYRRGFGPGVIRRVVAAAFPPAAARG
jgi:regulatory protein